jgi:hypothetical protein
VSKRLQELSPKHKAACRLRIEGKNNEYIAKEIGTTKRTLVQWWGDDQVKDYLQKLAENVEQEFAIQLARAGMKSIAALTEILDLDVNPGDNGVSPHTKLEVARELMDRLPGTARIGDRNRGNQGGGEGTQVNVFQNMTPEQLAAFVQGGWQGVESPAQLQQIEQ